VADGAEVMIDPVDARLRKGAAVMRVDALTAEVVHAFRDAGVRAIVLKGPAIARWLYDEIGDRHYTDSDLLVSPVALSVAEAVLSERGFVRGQSGWLSKSREWRCDRGLVDLHTSLFGIDVDDATAWELLAADTEPLSAGGITVEVLGQGARAFHLATHAAQHDRTFNKPQGDLERGVDVVALDVWRDAARLAERLGATGTFAAGLQRVGADELLKRLGLTSVRMPAAAALLAGDPPPTALGISQLAQARTTRARLSVLARGVIPQPRYMRAHYPEARRGRARLGYAYAARACRLARHLPAGVRAWRRAGRTG
jgi:hypothetical protein